MVKDLARYFPSDTSVEIQSDDVKWLSVSLSEVYERKLRLDASVFDIEGRQARTILTKCRWASTTITGKDGLAEAYHRPRFKRVFVEKSNLPIYQPSQITDIYPKPYLWISDATRVDVNSLRVKKNQVLVSCSGTIGKCSIVNETLDNKIFSHDLLRITAFNESDAGYIYAFIKTNVGQTLLKTNNYGAVINHIEPEHLAEVPIPNPSPIIKTEIHNLILASFGLLDESNNMLDEAELLLIRELKLPSIENLRLQYFDSDSECKNFSVRLSEIDERLESTYHKPLVRAILDHIHSNSKEVTTIRDQRICRRIIAPGRFKRVYVEEDQGVPFFGGKELFQLDPRGEKFLSFRHHSKRIKDELTLKENFVMVTCSGTIGKLAIVPKHWEGLAANQHILRIVPANDSIAGYLYAWLATDYGKEMIRRFSYGAVVSEIDARHLMQVQIPLLRNEKAQHQINDLVLASNQKRYEAYLLEQKALQIMNNKVLYA